MLRKLALALFLMSILIALTWAQPLAANSPAPAAGATAVAPAGPAFDVKAATDAYLATVPADKKARSDAYFEGGYWLQLWDFLFGAVVAIFLLHSRLSAHMRDWAGRFSSWRGIQTLIYFIQFLAFTTIVQFPMAVYEGYYREHKYGLATQTFGPWMRDQMVGLAVGAVLGGIAVVGLYALVRRLGKNWWVWGAVASIVFMAFIFLIAPVYIAPLFNTFNKLKDPKIKDPILSMARANGIPATEVYEVDASRQSTRISAYVSGFLGTERIVLNDNLLKRCSPEEIQSVMGHEMGHYVLHHVYKDLIFFGILFVAGFAFLNWGMHWCLARWGERWGAREITDVAALPLAVLLFSIFFFVLTPVTNSWVRMQEYEADIFGLDAGRQPDGEALVDVKLGDYRKLDPGPLEEMILFDHPSGRTRITAAMRWKAENMAVLPPGTKPGKP
ncbi:MAG: M48 family metallopeptidase [Acidobacteriales bacterium]|nr:M48 family metallopeptidase [Terriglobales bacterium]